MNNELVKLTEQIPLEKPKAQVVMDQFNQFFDQVSEYEVKARSIEIKDASQIAEMQEARTIRLRLKDIRVNAEKVKKSLKENILVEGRFIDGCYNLIAGTIQPIENDLLEKEKYVERIEQARLEKIKIERFNMLAECEVDGTFFDLVNMPDAAFNILLETSKTNHKNKIEAEKQAEAERLAREKSEIEEREKIKAENERLKKEAELREIEIKKEKEKQEKENAIRFAKEEAERKAIEAERQKLEAERLRIANEQKAKEEAEKKAKLEEAEKQRQASLMPDKNKLITLANSIDKMELPELNSDESNHLLSEVKIKLTAVSNFIRENCQKL
jgi:DNA-binding protein